MLQHVLWVLALGLGLVLLGAPAEATKCDTSCDKKNDDKKNDRTSRDFSREKGNGYEFGGKKAVNDASPLQLKSKRGREISVAYVPVDSPSKELAKLSKKSKSSKGADSSARRGKHPFLPIPKGVTPPDQPAQSPVPEPTGLVLFGGGLLVAAAALRRRRV
jgi:hypothetical protein